MANGWAGDGAVQDQIDSTIADAVAHARARLQNDGSSWIHCEDCGEEIPERRRQALPGVRRCVRCQQAHDRQDAVPSGYNRRGSKDSQLR